MGGANAFFVDADNNYGELFIGLENILKIVRLDVVGSYLNGDKTHVAVRIGLGGIFSNSLGK